MPKRQASDIQFLAKGRVVTPGLSLTDALAQKMADLIQTGKLSKGAMLPPLRKLADRHGVGVITVKRAIESLIQSGLIESLPRVGYRIPSSKDKSVKKIGIIYHNLHFRQGSSLSIDSIEKSIKLHNHVLMIGASHGNTKEEDECIKRFRLAGMDGLIIAPAFEGKKSNELEQWIKDEKPIVLEGHAGAWKLSNKVTNNCPKIDFDNQAGMTLIMDYLWSLGHRHILLASSDKNPKSLRQQFFLDFMKQKGMKPEIFINKETELINTVMKKSLNPSSKISAVMCTDDKLAIRLLERFRLLNTKNSRYISVAGFGSQNLSATAGETKLTTIDFSLEELAKKITELLNIQFDKRSIVNKCVSIAPQLIIGNSCVPVLGE